MQPIKGATLPQRSTACAIVNPTNVRKCCSILWKHKTGVEGKCHRGSTHKKVQLTPCLCATPLHCRALMVHPSRHCFRGSLSTLWILCALHFDRRFERASALKRTMGFSKKGNISLFNCLKKIINRLGYSSDMMIVLMIVWMIILIR